MVFAIVWPSAREVARASCTAIERKPANRWECPEMCSLDAGDE